MIINYTDAEKTKIDKLEKKYEKLFAEAEAEIERLKPPNEPDLYALQKELKPLTPEWDNTLKLYEEWEKSEGDAYPKAKKRYSDLMQKLNKERSTLFKECEQRQFSELDNNPRKVAADFKRQVDALITEIYKEELILDEKLANEGGGFRSSIFIVATSKTSWKLYAPEVIATIKRSLHLYFDFVEDNEKQKARFTDYLEKAVYNSPYVATLKQGEQYEGIGGQIQIAAAPDALPVPAADVPQFFGRRINKVDYPLDKPNNNLWRGLLECDPNGQISFKFDVSTHNDKKKGNEAIVLYSLNFDDVDKDLKISKTLEPYDKRIYIAAAALYNAGNTVISIAQIYKAMGFDGTPGKGEREKIYNSMCKLMAAQMTLSNLQEVLTHKGRAKFDYKGALLQAELLQARINGDIVETAFHLFREPPLISFARERKQITTLDRKLLQTPLNKTNQNLLIEDYLIDHIAAVKSGRRSGKLLYKTIYENTGITTKLQRSRAPEKISKILTYWKENTFIKDFQTEKDGITISV